MLLSGLRAGLIAAVGLLMAKSCDDDPSPTEPVDAGAYTSCSTADDCAWGEIDHEIQKRSDCTCLYGCPYLALNKTTIARRQQQHQSLCDPRTNGQGDPCGIDDCIVPPKLACVSSVCVRAPDAGSD